MALGHVEQDEGKQQVEPDAVLLRRDLRGCILDRAVLVLVQRERYP